MKLIYLIALGIWIILMVIYGICTHAERKHKYAKFAWVYVVIELYTTVLFFVSIILTLICYAKN
jgi:hypothetical protein